MPAPQVASLTCPYDLVLWQEFDHVEHHKQLLFAKQFVEYKAETKREQTVMKTWLYDEMPLIVFSVHECWELLTMPYPLARHWKDCHELYVWYYYCTLCNNQQKLAHEVSAHAKHHLIKGHMDEATALGRDLGLMGLKDMSTQAQ